MKIVINVWMEEESEYLFKVIREKNITTIIDSKQMYANTFTPFNGNIDKSQLYFCPNLGNVCRKNGMESEPVEPQWSCLE